VVRAAGGAIPAPKAKTNIEAIVMVTVSWPRIVAPSSTSGKYTEQVPANEYTPLGTLAMSSDNELSDNQGEKVPVGRDEGRA
jgi:hypothetical protein